MKAASLSLRDPALAAVLGAGAFQAGSKSDFGADFGDDGDFGEDFGSDFGAEAASPIPKPTAAQALSLWNSTMSKRQGAARRRALLNPNAGSDVKVERYGFSVNGNLVLGVAGGLSLTGQPDTTIRPQRVTMNAPANGFVTISDIKVANVSVLVGGVADAFEYSSHGVGQELDMPTLSPANRASVSGAYTGYIPQGYVGGSSYLFVVSFKGPASVQG